MQLQFFIFLFISQNNTAKADASLQYSVTVFRK